MKLKKILDSGYFPKELPPPFNTKSFGEKSRYVIIKWGKLLADKELQQTGESLKDAKKRFNETYTQKYGSSKLTEYSISKGMYSRRKLEIPNPKHPSNIKQVFKIVLSYEFYINQKSKEKITSVLEKIITEHISLNHSFEVSWALWFYKSFSMKCKTEILVNILKSHDEISKLITLDLIDSKLFIGKKPSLTGVLKSIDSQSLYNEKWIFSYETFIKKWLDYKDKNILSDNEFFEILDYYKISFYDRDIQLKTEFTVRPIEDFDDHPFDDWAAMNNNNDDDDDDDDDGGEY